MEKTSIYQQELDHVRKEIYKLFEIGGVGEFMPLRFKVKHMNILEDNANNLGVLSRLKVQILKKINEHDGVFQEFIDMINEMERNEKENRND